MFSFLLHILLNNTKYILTSFIIPNVWSSSSSLKYGLGPGLLPMGYTSTQVVFKCWRWHLSRTAALFAYMPSSNTDFKVSCICSSLHCFLTELCLFCSGLVVEPFEQSKPFFFLFDMEFKKELEQNRKYHTLIINQFHSSS